MPNSSVFKLTIAIGLLALLLGACNQQGEPPELPAELAEGDPVATPFDTRPSALNREAFQAALAQHTPEDVTIAPGSDTVMVNLLIDTDGNVRRTVVSNSSGQPELDRAAETVARILEFEPARRDAEPVAVWYELPIIFGL